MPIPSIKPKGTVSENLIILKGRDCKISSEEEARAILKYIPIAEIRSQEDAHRLVLARVAAENYLKNGDISLLAYGIKAARYIKKQSPIYWQQLANFVNNTKEKLASL